MMAPCARGCWRVARRYLQRARPEFRTLHLLTSSSTVAACASSSTFSRHVQFSTQVRQTAGNKSIGETYTARSRTQNSNVTSDNVIKVALVGATNVGKSALYNRFRKLGAYEQIGDRLQHNRTPALRALVSPQRGTTRNRRSAHANLFELPVYVTDLPAFEGWDLDPSMLADDTKKFAAASLRQALHAQIGNAVSEADVVLLVVDAKRGLDERDKLVADALLGGELGDITKRGHDSASSNARNKIILVANKVDNDEVVDGPWLDDLYAMFVLNRQPQRITDAVNDEHLDTASPMHNTTLHKLNEPVLVSAVQNVGFEALRDRIAAVAHVTARANFGEADDGNRGPLVDVLEGERSAAEAAQAIAERMVLDAHLRGSAAGSPGVAHVADHFGTASLAEELERWHRERRGEAYTPELEVSLREAISDEVERLRAITQGPSASDAPPQGTHHFPTHHNTAAASYSLEDVDEEDSHDEYWKGRDRDYRDVEEAEEKQNTLEYVLGRMMESREPTADGLENADCAAGDVDENSASMEVKHPDESMAASGDEEDLTFDQFMSPIGTLERQDDFGGHDLSPIEAQTQLHKLHDLLEDTDPDVPSNSNLDRLLDVSVVKRTLSPKGQRMAYLRTLTLDKRRLNVSFIGTPNSGKSSLMNSLLAACDSTGEPAVGAVDAKVADATRNFDGSLQANKKDLHSVAAAAKQQTTEATDDAQSHLRSVVSNVAGTTTDAVLQSTMYHGRDLLLADTCGVWRGLRHAGLKKGMQMAPSPDEVNAAQPSNTGNKKYKTPHRAIADPGDSMRRTMRKAHVVVLVVEPMRAGISSQLLVPSKFEVALANWALREGRNLIVAVNKWDTVPPAKRADLRKQILSRVETKITGATDVSVVFCSAKRAINVTAILDRAFVLLQRWNKRIKTPALNNWLHEFTKHFPPGWKDGQQINIKYAAQLRVAPPCFVIFSNLYGNLPESYMRFLFKNLRKQFSMDSIPIQLSCRSTLMPDTTGKLKRRRDLTKWRKLGPKQAQAAAKAFGMKKTKLSRKLEKLLDSE